MEQDERLLVFIEMEIYFKLKTNKLKIAKLLKNCITLRIFQVFPSEKRKWETQEV